MTPDELEIFQQTVDYFQNMYPSAELQYTPNGMCSAIVYDRETQTHSTKQFNTDGYNLLYCLANLCGLLKERLR